MWKENLLRSHMSLLRVCSIVQDCEREESKRKKQEKNFDLAMAVVYIEETFKTAIIGRIA